ncbi:MAG TPA: peptide chain release factor 2 [Rhodospirillaceae bacterium]|nr:peptide chain release factor 2 [Rhodospirillaceae bacterium]MAX63113.1 peptide chain release factor 2 [Rhodospirillaceae bacterium]MBB57960.1 peptide chain release factor 2 [Rhodospirillaceae bacterium]HAJ22604.1 peptide chain release factor 2 [Rhodospirillaceae bacterium]HBM14382.1 peptide chain release factor 2 [Rhodospirillaceae bacterium]
MRAETQAVVDELKQSLELLRRHLDWDVSTKRLEELNARVEDPTLWDDPTAAQKVMRERSSLETRISGFLDLESGLNDNVEMIELAEAEGDQDLITEAESALGSLRDVAAKQQLQSMLSGEADGNDCFLEVHAGAGGTESQDWAEMLQRMYLRWADKRGFKTEMLEESPGEEAGIKSTTIRIQGENAYGWLKTETGVHRLVRISPYDSNARRHTSFSSVKVYPEIDDSIDVEINDGDLRIDTYRASGAGGQHVNRTDSAVRITHIPSGIVVQCQNDRSQHKNRAQAMKMLTSRLYEAELKRREAAAQDDFQAETEIGWGRQIRSYVLQPYQMVKDLRTGVETSNTGGVLDGDIDAFLEASLASKLEGGTSAVEDLD